MGTERDPRLDRMKELCDILSAAGRAYYQESREVMSNFEYDRLYDELLRLEEETGTVFAGSPTHKVGYEILSELPKEQHEKPMLSLNKTKNVEELQEWLGDHEGLLSWKLDGLTVVLTYEDGELKKAVTRGNGETGEVITPNARTFLNIPQKIAYKDQLILRGEAVITYSDFEKINEAIGDIDARYKNPRNLCSGSVRQLNSRITAERRVRFIAFALVKADGVDFENSREKQFQWLTSLGFETVHFEHVRRETLPDTVHLFAEKIVDYDVPSDGLVLAYDDLRYGASLGRTAKFPRDSIAFKWADEIEETVLREIEWSASRTGLINPVAVFDPVSLEGTTVSRASVHNVSIVESLKLGIGDKITVYKANMIIPQIADNLTKSGKLEIPEICPVCGGKTEIRSANDVRSLYCTNPECQAKKIKSFALFVSRDALNVDGLSEATLEKFIAAGFIHEFADIFQLNRFRDKIVVMEGFGEKSCNNLIAAAEKASHTTLWRLIYGLGIEGIGLAGAKLICRHFDFDLEKMRAADEEEMMTIDGVGEVLAAAWVRYFRDGKKMEILEHLLELLDIEKEVKEEGGEQTLEGKVIVITGSLEHFANRKELEALIESKGGKVTSSVTKKTSILVNNDTTSQSSKNKKAKELGIPILSEEDFLSLAGVEE